jgi:hypothetical protein
VWSSASTTRTRVKSEGWDLTSGVAVASDMGGSSRAKVIGALIRLIERGDTLADASAPAAGNTPPASVSGSGHSRAGPARFSRGNQMAANSCHLVKPPVCRVIRTQCAALASPSDRPPPLVAATRPPSGLARVTARASGRWQDRAPFVRHDRVREKIVGDADIEPESRQWLRRKMLQVFGYEHVRLRRESCGEQWASFWSGSPAQIAKKSSKSSIIASSNA